jgi:hypothetical protein
MAQETTITFHLRSTCPALMQAETLANPLADLTRELKKITGKKRRTDTDHEEMARIEFLAGLYYDPKIGPYWPGINIDRMFCDAAKITRRGQDVKRAFMVLDSKVPLIYDGPRTPKAMYEDSERFVDMRSVVIQQKRTMRCRPIFHEWEVEFTAMHDPDVINREDVIGFAETAGRMIGLSTFRPRYGRFVVVSAT